MSSRLLTRTFASAVGALAWVLGHDVAYRLADLDPSHAPHGYVPVLAAMSALVAVLSLAAFIALLLRRRVKYDPLGIGAWEGWRLAAWILAPGMAFVAVEIAEQSFSGTPPLVLLLVGTGLQIVLAVAAHLASRALLVTLTAAVRRRDVRFKAVRAGRRSRPDASVVPAAPLTGAGACRAPPAG